MMIIEYLKYIEIVLYLKRSNRYRNKMCHRMFITNFQYNQMYPISSWYNISFRWSCYCNISRFTMSWYFNQCTSSHFYFFFLAASNTINWTKEVTKIIKLLLRNFLLQNAILRCYVYLSNEFTTFCNFYINIFVKFSTIYHIIYKTEQM